jgi:ferredoxin
MAALATHPQWIALSELDALLEVLRQRGYTLVGPTISQDAIVYDEINTVADLPRGWTDQQQPGSYRLARRDDDALFGYVVGPHSWKKYLFPPVSTVATADRTPQGWQFNTPDEAPPHLAFLGVRACELAAIAIQDRVFMSDQYVDPIYQARRQACCLIAVNCTQAASTCFCTSMGTGPECTAGFDLALTELADGFLIESGSSLGEALLAELVHRPASDEELTAGTAARQQAIDQITKQLDTTNIRNLLLNNLNHPHWDDVAQRCLSCTNCTLVCPTCFCHSVGDVADLQGDHVDRVRHWDSCFNFDFSYVNGGVVRNSVRSRYRQWLTHKLATWFDQFDSSGCVGCGRCITWCPVAIDLTQEVAAIRESSA